MRCLAGSTNGELAILRGQIEARFWIDEELASASACYVRTASMNCCRKTASDHGQRHSITALKDFPENFDKLAVQMSVVGEQVR
jgi:hypothetical protein